MQPENGQRAYDIFRAVLDKVGADRFAFLDEACGDDTSLRAEVEALLAADARSTGFLETRPGNDAAGLQVAPGQRLSHYVVERQIGAGGMGQVFLARDLALGRLAAIKVLRQQFGAWERTRLLREAETSARLQHPAIATFYEAGEAEGVAFIAMEHVEGRTLRQALGDGPLTADEGVAIVECVLEALAHAHGAGLLHRDIKPENIMVTGSRTAKLLDFGIAKQLFSQVGDSAPTAALPAGRSLLAGTAGYMSPEQLQGEALDARSDLFAVGVVLYETLTGRRAFPGDTVGQCMARTLAPELPPMQGGILPPGMEAVLSRALARRPEERYPSAAAFLSDLRRLGTGEATATLPQTLAVLDLQNLRGDANDEWIASGMAESVAASLHGVAGLTVIPRERAVAVQCRLRASGRPHDALDVGLALGCRWILAGSFQRVGSMLRCTACLTEVATGRAVYAQNLDGAADRIFQLQDRLAAAVLAHLNLARPAPKSPPRLDAYECYSRGRRLFTAAQKGSLERAGEMFQQAIDLDSAYAAAYVGMAGVHAMHFPAFTDERDLELACDNANRAVQLAPELGEAHAWIGYALFRRARYEEALRTLRTAMALEPGNLFAPYFAGACLEAMGQRRDAVEPYRRCIELSPSFGWAWLGLGWVHLDLGNFAEAAWCLHNAVDLERAGQSFTPGVAGHLAECLRRSGKLADARSAALTGLEATEKSDSWYRDTFRGVCLVALGRTALDQGDREAARAAFTQAVLHHQGRPRALGCGHLLVQALAGLVRAGDSEGRLDQAVELFEARRAYSFHWLWCCSDEISLLELGRSASVAGRLAEGQDLLSRARLAGAAEADGVAASLSSPAP